ncbi:MAG: DUF362 domain-containing protein [Treponema sp.]|jgi:uncharacterized protein (DUF362 family)|nr:DUF362 domain-containing protein [Treponema sp.]
MAKAKVFIVSTEDRAAGTRRCLASLGKLDYSGKYVYVKPNFNTADPTPGSTHYDTLDALLAAVRAANPARIVLGERSGPADVGQVFKQLGIPELCEKYDVEFLNLETMPENQWVAFERPGLHWQGGFFVPKALLDADAVVATCCLKTHGFGGVYSNALKLAVGITRKDFMKLHGDDGIRQRIAEINLAYKPDFVLSDAVEVFTDGGPMTGVRKNGNAMLISSDRVALDACGLALLKSLGSNSAIMDTPVFKQEQMVRAVELGLGVSSPNEIDVLSDDEASEKVAALVREFLHK